jgi:hypothetical protein
MNRVLQNLRAGLPAPSTRRQLGTADGSIENTKQQADVGKETRCPY